MTVIIYTKKGCPWCTKAKTLLEQKNVEYEEHEITDNKNYQEMIEKYPDARTVPQIFINGNHIGGCKELYDLDERNELDKILADNDSSFDNQDTDSEEDESGYESDELDMLDITPQSDNDIL